jgi:hypothetical protein
VILAPGVKLSAIRACDAEVAVVALPLTVGTLKTPVEGLNVMFPLSSVLTACVPANSEATNTKSYAVPSFAGVVAIADAEDAFSTLLTVISNVVASALVNVISASLIDAVVTNEPVLIGVTLRANEAV